MNPSLSLLHPDNWAVLARSIPELAPLLERHTAALASQSWTAAVRAKNDALALLDRHGRAVAALCVEVPEGSAVHRELRQMRLVAAAPAVDLGGPWQILRRDPDTLEWEPCGEPIADSVAASDRLERLERTQPGHYDLRRTSRP